MHRMNDSFGRRLVGDTIALATLLCGVKLAHGGLIALLEWQALSPGYFACAAAFLGAGIVMMACSAWAVVTRGRKHSAFWIGGAATVIAGAVLSYGVVSHVVPCTGPA